jgi:hypothetical protein
MTTKPSETTKTKATHRIPIPSKSVVMPQITAGMTLTHVNAIQKAVAVSDTRLPGPGSDARPRFMFI